MALATAVIRRGFYSILAREVAPVFQQIPPVAAVVEVGEGRVILSGLSLEQEQVAAAESGDRQRVHLGCPEFVVRRFWGRLRRDVS